MANRIEIPIENGWKIVAEQNSDPNYSREIYVGIEDANGVWMQDLVCIQNKYQYKGFGCSDEDWFKWIPGLFHVIVWGDNGADDYTDKFTIPLREDA